jgi:hypothetical protein
MLGWPLITTREITATADEMALEKVMSSNIMITHQLAGAMSLSFTMQQLFHLSTEDVHSRGT